MTGVEVGLTREGSEVWKGKANVRGSEDEGTGVSPFDHPMLPTGHHPRNGRVAFEIVV